MNTKYMLVGICENQGKKQYMVCDKSSRNVSVVDEKDMLREAQTGRVENAICTKAGLECTSSSINSLPVYRDGQLVKNGGITVLQVHKSKYSQTHYLLLDVMLRTAVVNETEAIRLIEAHKSINAKIVVRNGKKFISAKRGNLDTKVYDANTDNKKNNNKNKNSQSKDEITSKYLGVSMSINPCEVWMEYRRYKSAVEKLENKDEEIPIYLLTRNSYKAEKYIVKVARAFIAGSIGKKYKNHYKETLKALKEMGIKEAEEVILMINRLSSLERYALGRSYKTCRKMLDTYYSISNSDKVLLNLARLKEKMYMDYLRYAKDNLVTHNIADLVKLISEYDISKKYIENNASTKDIQKVLKDSVRKSANKDAHTVEGMMFISALQLIVTKKLAENDIANGDSMRNIKIRCTHRIRSITAYVANVLNGEPVNVEGDKHPGALIFQSTVLAIEEWASQKLGYLKRI